MDARGFAQNRASLDCMHVWHNHLKADEPAKLLSNDINNSITIFTDNHVGVELFNSTHSREAHPNNPISDIRMKTCIIELARVAVLLSSIRS